MTNWGMLEAKIVNRDSKTRPGYWVLGDDNVKKTDGKEERFIRATLVPYGGSTKGDAVFPYFQPKDMNGSARKLNGFKSPSTGLVNGHVQIMDGGDIRYSNLAGRLQYEALRRMPNAQDGAMTFETFLEKMNGGHPINVCFDQDGNGTCDTTVRYPGKSKP